MLKRILTTTIFAVLAIGLLLMPIYAAKAQAADKIGWVGPVYKELSESLNKGFKAYLGNFLYFFVNVNGNMIRVQVPHHVPQKEGQELYLFLNPQKCMILL